MYPYVGQLKFFHGLPPCMRLRTLKVPGNSHCRSFRGRKNNLPGGRVGEHLLPRGRLDNLHPLIPTTCKMEEVSTWRTIWLPHTIPGLARPGKEGSLLPGKEGGLLIPMTCKMEEVSIQNHGTPPQKGREVVSLLRS